MSSKVTRRVDPRKAHTGFMQSIRRIVARTSAYRTVASSGLSVMTRSVPPRRFVSTDTPNGVVIVTSLSDLPQHRANAARILGTDVQVIHADTFGTVYAPKGL